MKTKIIFIALIFIGALNSCRKSDSGTAPKKLNHIETSDILSEGRYSMQLLQTGNYSCFIGGEIFSVSPFGTKKSTNTDVYNIQDDSWNRFGLSVKRDYYATAALNNVLIIAGGAAPNYAYSSVADVFDLATGRVTATHLSQARGFLAAAGAGNKILFAGGSLPDKVSARVDIYNTQTGQWTMDSLSVARANLSGGAAGNKIVFAGGTGVNNNNEPYYSDRVDIYDVQTGQWTWATLSQPRKDVYVISAGTKILFIGGVVTSNYETVDVYDVQTNRWTVLTLTGNTLPNILACTNGSKVFLTSGTNFDYTKFHVYDIGGGQLNTVPLPSPIRASGMTALGNKVMITAGVLADTITSKVFVYDTQGANFDTTSFSLPERKALVTAAAAGNRILLAGGVWDNSLPGQLRKVINYKTVTVFELK